MNFVEVECDFCGGREYKPIMDEPKGFRSLSREQMIQCFNHSDLRLKKKAHFRIVKCKECGLVFSSPRLINSELSDCIGSVEWEQSKEKPDMNRGRNLELAERVERHLGYKGTALDVGCGFGHILQAFNEKGWDVFGIEPSIDAADYVSKLGLQVESVFWEDFKLSKRFDVIIMYDVLEHSFSPSQALLKAHSYLKDGGILVIVTINMDSLYARITGERFQAIGTYHLYYFSIKTLMNYFNKFRFEVIENYPEEKSISLPKLTKFIFGKRITKIIQLPNWQLKLRPGYNRVWICRKKDISK